jgi:hypothetical protein
MPFPAAPCTGPYPRFVAVADAKKAATGKLTEVPIVHRDGSGKETRFLAIDNVSRLTRHDWFVSPVRNAPSWPPVVCCRHNPRHLLVFACAGLVWLRCLRWDPSGSSRAGPWVDLMPLVSSLWTSLTLVRAVKPRPRRFSDVASVRPVIFDFAAATPVCVPICIGLIGFAGSARLPCASRRHHSHGYYFEVEGDSHAGTFLHLVSVSVRVQLPQLPIFASRCS